MYKQYYEPKLRRDRLDPGRLARRRHVEELERQVRDQAIGDEPVEPRMQLRIEVVDRIAGHERDEDADRKHVGHRPLAHRSHEQVEAVLRRRILRQHDDGQHPGLDERHDHAEQQHQAGDEVVLRVVQPPNRPQDALRFLVERLLQQRHRRRDRQGVAAQARNDQGHGDEGEADRDPVARAHAGNLADLTLA